MKTASHSVSQLWASEGFFQGGGKSGEILFLPLEIEETTFFC